MESSPIGKLFDREPISGNTIFHVLAELGSLELLYRIRANVDESCHSILNKKNYNGEFSTHVVIRNHRGQHAIKLMEILTTLGADLNTQEGLAGFTALHEAILRDDYEMAAWLCQQPTINLNLKTFGGLTAYQLAFRRKNKEMMDILRKHGANCEEPQVSESDLSDSEIESS